MGRGRPAQAFLWVRPALGAALTADQEGHWHPCLGARRAPVTAQKHKCCPRPRGCRKVNVHSMRGGRCPDVAVTPCCLGTPDCRVRACPVCDFLLTEVEDRKRENQKGFKPHLSSGGERLLPAVFFLS